MELMFEFNLHFVFEMPAAIVRQGLKKHAKMVYLHNSEPVFTQINYVAFKIKPDEEEVAAQIVAQVTSNDELQVGNDMVALCFEVTENVLMTFAFVETWPVVSFITAMELVDNQDAFIAFHFTLVEIKDRAWDFVYTDPQMSLNSKTYWLVSCQPQ